MIAWLEHSVALDPNGIYSLCPWTSQLLICIMHNSSSYKGRLITEENQDSHLEELKCKMLDKGN